MDADLSTDGVDEALRIMYAGVPPWGRFTPDPTQAVRIRTTDTRRSWLVTLGQFTGTEEDGTVHDEPDLDVAVVDIGERTAATVSGVAADLDCWLWHRPPVGEAERAGDPLVLERFDQTIALASADLSCHGQASVTGRLAASQSCVRPLPRQSFRAQIG